MIKPIYLFIDESGDNGDNDGTGGNTLYYTELVIQAEYESLRPLVRHIINWRYVEGIMGEPKYLPNDERKCNDFLKPIIELHQAGAIKCSAVFLLKPNYSGPYLKAHLPTGHHPIQFRNFVHKQLLKHHFGLYPRAQEGYISAIFDYYRMSRSDLKNVTDYLCNICNFALDNISHFDSYCSWVLQTAGQLANGVSQIPLGNAGKSRTKMLSFISLKDITNI